MSRLRISLAAVMLIIAALSLPLAYQGHRIREAARERAAAEARERSEFAIAKAKVERRIAEVQKALEAARNARAELTARIQRLRIPGSSIAQPAFPDLFLRGHPSPRAENCVWRQED